MHLLKNIFDAAAMIVSELGLRKPGSYSELGIVLYEVNLIDENVREEIKKIASIRNVLVHAYRKLSSTDLVEIVEKALPIIKHVAKKLLEIVEKKNIDPVTKHSSCFKYTKLEEIFRRNNVVLAYLFGSRTKGLERRESDYDIAVLFGKNKVSVLDEVELAIEIADTLNIPVDKVDI